MRGFVIGAALMLVVVVSVLSLRPGGLRNQLRNIARRLRLALILAGIYIVVSAVVRIALPGSGIGEIALVGIAALLAVVFLVLGQDRQLDGR